MTDSLAESYHIVQFSCRRASLASAVIPARIPAGMDATLLDGIIGYTDFAAGFDFIIG
jgi:hypothetical protein